MSEMIVLAGIAAGVTFGFAAAEAHDIRVQTKVVVAQAQPAAPVLSAADKAEVGQASAEQIVQQPVCSRKVKVIYSGYGEASRAACPEQVR